MSYRARHWASHSVASIAFGVCLTAMLNADIGLSPYDAFVAASADKIGLTVAVALVIVSTVFLVIAWLLGRRPGPGTVTNYLLAAVTVAVVQPFIPTPGGGWAVVQGLVGAVGMAFFAGIIIASAHLGTGPYSQLVLGVSDRMHLPVWGGQMVCDGIVFVSAFALGARFGIGTIIPLVAFPLVMPLGIRLGTRILSPRTVEA